jgi:hypothetical protein
MAKQGLSVAGPENVHDATLAAAGVYGTAPTCYLSYAARVEGFRLAHLDEELYARRRLVRLRCMRESVYIEPVEALPVVVAATGAGEKAAVRLVRLSGLTEGEFAALADRIEGLLAGRPPATVSELREMLGAHVPPRRGALQYVVALMSRQARLVRAEVRGSWRSDTHAYARWADWVGTPLKHVDPETARAELARRYLRAFGPATAADLKWWAGWTVRDTTAAVSALGEDVVEISLTDGEAPSTSLVLTEELAALSAADPGSAPGVRLLPVWDAYVMGYAQRRRLVAGPDYARVYDRAGNGTSVVLLDGVAAGVWELEHASGPPGGSLTVRVAPFGPALVSRWAEAEEAAARVAAAIGADELRVERSPQPGPLADGARNAFLAPIRLGGSS